MKKRYEKPFDDSLVKKFKHIKQYIVKQDATSFICNLCNTQKPLKFEYLDEHLSTKRHNKAVPEKERHHLTEVLKYFNTEDMEEEEEKERSKSPLQEQKKSR